MATRNNGRFDFLTLDRNSLERVPRLQLNPPTRSPENFLHNNIHASFEFSIINANLCYYEPSSGYSFEWQVMCICFDGSLLRFRKVKHVAMIFFDKYIHQLFVIKSLGNPDKNRAHVKKISK